MGLALKLVDGRDDNNFGTHLARMPVGHQDQLSFFTFYPAVHQQQDVQTTSGNAAMPFIILHHRALARGLHLSCATQGLGHMIFSMLVGAFLQLLDGRLTTQRYTSETTLLESLILSIP